MHPRLLGFKPKEPNKISFKLENNNITINIYYRNKQENKYNRTNQSTLIVFFSEL